MGSSVATGILLVRRRSELRFIPARCVRRVLGDRPITELPGAGFGLTWADGEIVCVHSVDAIPGPIVLCNVDGGLVGIRGLEVVGPARCAVDAQRALVDGVWIDELDLEDLTEASAPAL